LLVANYYTLFSFALPEQPAKRSLVADKERSDGVILPALHDCSVSFGALMLFTG